MHKVETYVQQYNHGVVCPWNREEGEWESLRVESRNPRTMVQLWKLNVF